MDGLFANTIEPGKELTLIDYMNELDIVVKPVLRILYELEADHFNMDNQDLKCLLFTAVHGWERIDKIFLTHNRRVNGLPETIEDYREFQKALKAAAGSAERMA